MPTPILSSLALVAGPVYGAHDCTYSAYYAPSTGDYVLVRSQGPIITYSSAVNEVDFSACWENRESIAYSLQALAGIDYSPVALQILLMQSIASNKESTETFIQNQLDNTTANQEQLHVLQEIAVAMKEPVANPAQPAARVSVINNPSTYPVTGEFWPAVQPVSGALTNEELRATPVPITVSFPETQHVAGSVSITAFPEVQRVQIENPTTAVTIANQPTSYPVTGRFWQETQPVKGPLTNEELRASALPVVVAFPATQQVQGTVAVANYPTVQRVSIDNPVSAVSITNQPSTYPVTGNFWQEVQPVSGPLTDSQLRATPLAVQVGFPTVQRVSVDNQIANPDVSDRSSRQLGHVVVDNFPAAQAITGTITVSNPVNTVAISSLPAGLGTSTNQLIANVALNSIDTKLSVVSTASLQTTANTSLASIDSKLTSPLLVKTVAASAGGVQSRLVVASVVGTTPTLVKAGQGQLYDLVVSNTGSAISYLSFYNKSSAPAANDIPVAIYPLPALSTTQLSFPLGLSFSQGIAFAITSNLSITGILSGLLTANTVIVNLNYA